MDNESEVDRRSDVASQAIVNAAVDFEEVAQRVPVALLMSCGHIAEKRVLLAAISKLREAIDVYRSIGKHD
jgi:hypothetical protein